MGIFVVREEFSILVLVVVTGIYTWYTMTQAYTHNISHTYQIPGFYCTIVKQDVINWRNQVQDTGDLSGLSV